MQGRAGEENAVIGFETGAVRQVGAFVGRQADVGDDARSNRGDLGGIGLAIGHPVGVPQPVAMLACVAIDEEQAERAGAGLDHRVISAGMRRAMGRLAPDLI